VTTGETGETTVETGARPTSARAALDCEVEFPGGRFNAEIAQALDPLAPPLPPWWPTMSTAALAGGRSRRPAQTANATELIWRGHCPWPGPPRCGKP